MDFSRIQSYDITPSLEYRGKKLEELYPNHRIISNDFGNFMKIVWHHEDFEKRINLNVTRKYIYQNLKSVYYIGEKTESKLKSRGNKTLFDLRYHLRYNKSANQLIHLIRNKAFRQLCENKYINDIDVSFCFNIEEFLFLDIETLGIYDSPVIITGLGFYREGKFEINALFARNIEEEIAIFDYLRNKVLPHFKCFITYNGRSFDVPYLANRFLYYYDENPMISEDDTPYETTNTLFHHIDLYHNCRRTFKGKYEKYTLTNMEMHLLNWKRDNELPSSMVGWAYRKYQKNPTRYIGLIRECIEHNYYDIYSMPLILKKLIENK